MDSRENHVGWVRLLGVPPAFSNKLLVLPLELSRKKPAQPMAA
jgi:hypothetical protein